MPPGSKYKEINATVMSEFRIPVPPLKTGIQQKIVKECIAVDDSASKLIDAGIPLNDIREEMRKRRAAVFEKYL